jgi:hypothetical protein
MKTFVSALLLALGILGNIPGNAIAVPGEDPFAKPKAGPKASEHEPDPLEKAALGVVGALRSQKDYPATLGAVEFALYLYAESGRTQDLERADQLARDLREAAPEQTPAWPLFEVAQAGGPTLAAADEHFMTRQRSLAESGSPDTDTYAGLIRDFFARAAAFRSPERGQAALLASGTFFTNRTRIRGNRFSVVTGASEESAGLSAHIRTLRASLLTTSLSGSTVMRDDTGLLGHELIRRFWDDSAHRFSAGAEDTEADVLLWNAEAALLLWETGFLVGDRFLQARAKRALRSVLDDALKDRRVAPAAALAAVRVSSHPVQMVLIGTPRDPTLAALREASHFLFEPRRLLLNLDPAVDTPRLVELSYPPELAPVLFICVESICSAPIKSEEGLDGKVKEILKLASSVQE